MRRLIPYVAVLSLVGSACARGASTSATAGKPIVVTTTTQTADFVRVLAGDSVTVYDIIRPGIDPHDYEPTAADLHNITRAAVIVSNGVGLEPWLAKAKAATQPKGVVSVASDGVTLRKDDPHVWQNPQNAQIMVTNIAAALSRAIPAQTGIFAANLASYSTELSNLDAEITSALDHLTNRKVVTNHDAFGYFIDRYHLDFVGSVLPSFDTSSELSPADIRSLVAKIKAQQVHAIFSEASLPPKTAQAVAAEAGVRVVMGADALYGDSLGPRGSDGGTYLTMMRHNTRTLVRGLS
jgi:zinc/manganese transport system substrate-binding protein